MSSKILLELKNISKIYPMGNSEIHALENISIKVVKGEFVVVLGRSGSGKSTLLSITGGLESPTHGNVILDGVDLTELERNHHNNFRREKIGYIFQHFHLLDYLTVKQNLYLPLAIQGKNDPRSHQRLNYLILSMDLEKIFNKFPKELSGGQKQKVGIVRALVATDQLIIADEPTGDLDEEASHKIIDLLYQQRHESEPDNRSTEAEMDGKLGKLTTIMVTHDLNMLREGMRVIVLSDGQKIADFEYQGDLQKIVDLYAISSISR